jgi:hypothetical protein
MVGGAWRRRDPGDASELCSLQYLLHCNVLHKRLIREKIYGMLLACLRLFVPYE